MPASSDEYVSPQLKGSIWCHQKTSQMGAYTRKEYLAVVRVSTKQCPSLCAEKNAVFYVDRSFHCVWTRTLEKSLYVGECKTSVCRQPFRRICGILACSKAREQVLQFFSAKFLIHHIIYNARSTINCSL